MLSATSAGHYIVSLDLASSCTSYSVGFDGSLRIEPWLDRLLVRQSAVSALVRIMERLQEG